MKEENEKLSLSEATRSKLNRLADLASNELIHMFESGKKPDERARTATLILANYSRLHAAENGSNRITLTALSFCNFEKIHQRREYIRKTMPQLNLLK